MSKKATHKTRTITTNDDWDEKISAPKKKSCGLPLIKCTCGTEILLIPDIKGMNNAIENHLSTHNKMLHQKGKKKDDPNRIKQILTKEILAKASEIP